MARLTDKVKLAYQKKYTLEEIEGGDVTIDELQKMNPESNNPFYLVKFHKGKDTGFLSIGLPSLVEYFDKVDPAKDLPAEVMFVSQGRRWIVQ